MMNIDKGSFDELSDSEIWDSFRDGSEAAFEFIYQKFFDRLFQYGCQFTADRSLVEDAIQELFIELRRRSSHLSATDNILPYLYNAFRRKIIRLRDKARRNKEFDSNKSFEITISVEEEIVAKDLHNEDKERLEKAMLGLSEKYREVVYHFYYENLSYIEIQEILGFDNIKSVRNLLYKALKSLRNAMSIVLLLFLFIPKELNKQSLAV